jgi:vancomycin resistance protein YoaR
MRKRKTLVGLIIAVSILGTILFLPLALAFGKSGWDTKVLGKDFSMLSKKEILERLDGDFPILGTIKLNEKMTDNSRLFSIELSSISAEIDKERMISTLLYRRINQGLFKYMGAFFQERDFELEIKLDDSKLDKEIDRIVSQIEKPFIPSELLVEKGEIKVKDGQLGKRVDINILKEDILKTITGYNLDNRVEIPVEIIGFLPGAEIKTEVIEKASRLINKKVILTWEEEKSVVEKAEIINWIGFGDGCNLNKISGFVEIFGNSIKREPREAVFKFENGKVVEFEASKEGFFIDENKLTETICQGLVGWIDGETKEVVLELPLIRVEPKIKTETVNDLGIKELLGKGVSSFRHSSLIRNFNVEKGASIVNRILVAPNETFSFLKALGEVTLDNGYKKAYVIKKGKTELDVGGGICQVSTTFFRALLDAGLDITSRTAHAYRVSYYEEDSRPGFDATVFIPSPDLKFINDTGHHLLIQSIYDGKNKRLTYEIYGTSDGRKVEISNYRQWDAQPAPPDVWIDDPTLEPGKVVKDESKVPGLKASFEWKVTKGEEVLHQKTFTSAYVPWAAVYRRGPAQ